MCRLALGVASGQYNYPLRHALISNIVIPNIAHFYRTECKLVDLYIFMGYLNAIIQEKERNDIFKNDYTTFDDLYHLLALIAKACPSKVSTISDFVVKSGIMQYGSILQAQSQFLECYFLTSQSSQKEIYGTVLSILHACPYYTDSIGSTLFYAVFVHCRGLV